MLHFITNLHSYLQVEVLESEWKRFKDKVDEAEDLDKIIELQKKFIEVIQIRSMLTHESLDLYQVMMQIFEQIHKFTYTHDYLYTSALEEYHRRMTESEDMQDETQLISPEARQQLYLLGEQYRKNFEKFNDCLEKLEIDEKSLSFRLDFNEYYRELKQRDAYNENTINYDNFGGLDVDDIEDDDEEDEEEEEEDEEEQINTQAYKPSNQRGNNNFGFNR
jgi:hypothetical protein